MRIKIHYVIVDAQDGYASLHVFPNAKEKADFEEQCDTDGDYVMDNGVKVIEVENYEVVL